MGVYTHSDGNWLSRRGIFLIILVAFHLALFWALKSGFAVKFIKSVTPPIVAEIINEQKPEEPPPPPPEVKMELPPVQVPPVLVDIQIPVDAPTTALTTTVTDKPTPPAPTPPPPARVAVITKPAVTFRPDPQDYYPSTSRNLGEEGKVRVRICIDEKGKVNDVTVAETSNFQRLDEAGVRYGKAMRLKPGTEDGKPVPQCFVQPVTFSLKGEE